MAFPALKRLLSLKPWLVFTIIILSFNSIYASSPILLLSPEIAPKRKLDGKFREIYLKSPEKANTFSEIFAKSLFYGRIRSNNFLFLQNNDQGKGSSLVKAIGGSLIWKSACWYGAGLTLGIYSTIPYALSESDITNAHSGKDLFYLKESDQDGDGVADRIEAEPIITLSRIYLEYRSPVGSIKIGRFLLESRLTASNDTKMIPNSFQGIALQNTRENGYSLKFALLNAQKLRNRREFHELLYEDSHQGNTDSGHHLLYDPLSLTKLPADKLLIVESSFSYHLPIQFLLNSTTLWRRFNNSSLEIKIPWKWKDEVINLSCLLMKQSDLGIDKIIRNHPDYDSDVARNDDRINSTAGAWLIASKFDINLPRFSLRLAMHVNSDQGDIIAPWRGFPTGGYTRTMTEVNWTSGTTSLLCGIKYHLSSTLLINLNLARHDRPGDENDGKILYLGIRYDPYPTITSRWRLLIHRGKGSKNFIDTRLEFNYLF